MQVQYKIKSKDYLHEVELLSEVSPSHELDSIIAILLSAPEVFIDLCTFNFLQSALKESNNLKNKLCITE